MDQVKVFLRQLVKHRFWVLSGIVALIGGIVWMMSTAAIDTQFDERTKVIDTQYGSIKKVTGVQDHPNDFSHKKMDEIYDVARRQVGTAWTRQYERQVDILVWPKELKSDFEAAVINLRPIEAIPYPTPLDREIVTQLRDRYRNYIQNVVPQLAKVVNSNWSATPGAGGGGGAGGFGAGGGAMPGAGAPPGAGFGAGGGATSEEDKYVVSWNPQNQAAIMSRYDWSKQADNLPKTLQILYAQEDYWILTSLMKIIARTNDGADASFKAAVKKINAIDLGAFATRSGQVARVAGGGGGGGAGGAMGGMGGMGGMGAMPGAMPGGSSPPAMGGGPGGMGGSPKGGGMGGGAMPGAMPGMGGGGGGSGDGDPLENRYVDVNLEPLTAAKLRDALNVRSPQDALLAVVKRMPVRLQLTIDIRKMNRLLAECGNAEIPLEVRQVRINKLGAAASSGGGGGGAMPGGALGAGVGGGAPAAAVGGGEGGLGGLGGGAGGGIPGMGGGPRGARGAGSTTSDSFEIQVEIFGLVYLYNPPNEAKLGNMKNQTAGNSVPANLTPPGLVAAGGARN